MLGTDGDTEMHKHGIDSAFKRIVYATPALVVFRALFYRGLIVKQKTKPAHGGEARLRWEKGTRYTLIALALASLAWDWRLLVIGYLLPFVTVTPLVNTVRIVLEHFDLDRENPLWVGTFYRTGLFSRVMFWWGTGDCHMVHHFYANIPFYRMGAALKLIRPILIRHGVYEHRSLSRLLAQWFSGSRPHWSIPAAATTAEEGAQPRTA
jgi:fatty acid desaturase